MNKIAYTKQVLITCAKNKSVIVGSDLAKRVGMNGSADINSVLDDIAKECISVQTPNLTALVVQASTGVPSIRFFRIYDEDLVGQTRRYRKLKWIEIRDNIYAHYSS